MLFVFANQATAARRRVYFQLVAVDGITPATGEAGGQPQIASNGGAWTNTGIGTLTAIGNGRYYADLTQAAVQTAGDRIETRYKSGSTAECPGDSVRVVAVDPDDATRFGLSALPNVAAGANGGLPLGDGSGRTTVGSIAAGAITAAAIATDAIDADALAADAVTEIKSGLATDTALATAQSDLTAIKGYLDTEIQSLLDGVAAVQASLANTALESSVQDALGHLVGIKGDGWDSSASNLQYLGGLISDTWTNAGNTAQALPEALLSGLQPGTATDTSQFSVSSFADRDADYGVGCMVVVRRENGQVWVRRIIAYDDPSRTWTVDYPFPDFVTTTDRVSIYPWAGPRLTADLDPVANVDVPGLDALDAKVESLQAVLAGITSLANWLRALARKSAPDATAATEIGGTYDPTAHSLEAIRARGDAAWTGGGSGSDLTAEEIDTYLSAQHGAGQWGPAGSSGAYAVTRTVRDAATLSGIRDALVTVKSAAGTLLDQQRTNVDGVISFSLDSGDYLLSVSAPGYQTVADQALTVSGSGSANVDLSAFAVGAPSSPSLCRVYGYEYLNGNPVEARTVKAKLRGQPEASGNVVLEVTEVSDVTDADGYWYLDLVQTKTYHLYIPQAGVSQNITVPAASSVNVSDLLVT